MVCDVQELIDTNPCLMTLNPWQIEIVKTQMLCGIKNFLDSGAPITCDIQELLSDAACFNALNGRQLSAIQAQLLCDIAGLL
jgi:hypothetical protein